MRSVRSLALGNSLPTQKTSQIPVGIPKGHKNYNRLTLYHTLGIRLGLGVKELDICFS